MIARKTKKTRNLLHQKWAPYSEPSGITGLQFELLGVVIIISLLATLAVGSYAPLFKKAMLVEMSVYTDVLRRELTLAKVLEGRWPEAAEVGDLPYEGDHVEITDLVLDNGNARIGFVFIREPETRYQMELTRVDSNETFFWVCGYGDNKRYLEPATSGYTNVPEEYLVSTCR